MYQCEVAIDILYSDAVQVLRCTELLGSFLLTLELYKKEVPLDGFYNHLVSRCFIFDEHTMDLANLFFKCRNLNDFTVTNE